MSWPWHGLYGWAASAWPWQGPEPPPPPAPVVLVPPFFQRDVRGLSRFTRSSYPYLAARPHLRRLMSDHLGAGLRGKLLLSPPDDPRVSVRAKLRKDGGSMVLRWQPTSAAALHTFVELAASLDRAGDVLLRGSYLHPGSGLGAFLVAPLAKQLSGEAAQVGVRYSTPQLAAGAIVTPRNGELATAWAAARLGGLTLGLQVAPRTPLRSILEALTPPPQPPTPSPSAPSTSSKPAPATPAPATAASPSPTVPPAARTPSRSRSAASLLGLGLGLGLGGGEAGPGSDPEDADPLGEKLAAAAAWLRPRTSALLAYSPPPAAGAPGPSFTACVELGQAGDLTFSFFQHVALTRQVVNPFEEEEVVGITNYLDVGLQLTTAVRPPASGPPGTAPGPAVAAAGGSGGGAAGAAAGGVGEAGAGAGALPASVNLAASWQLNKNWLLKARLGSDSAAAAIGVRAWSAVSAYLTACVVVDYATRTPRYGGELVIENWGPLRYERGSDDVAAGRALLQRHEASPQERANAAGGAGVVIRRTVPSPDASAKAAQKAAALESERREVAALL